jgi:hypothetical protein
MRLFDHIPHDLKPQAVQHVIEFLRAVVGSAEEDDTLDELDDGENLPWFSAEEVKTNAVAFLRRIAETDALLGQICGEAVEMLAL